jgi:hypothetical protein
MKEGLTHRTVMVLYARVWQSNPCSGLECQSVTGSTFSVLSFHILQFITKFKVAN